MRAAINTLAAVLGGGVMFWLFGQALDCFMVRIVVPIVRAWP